MLVNYVVAFQPTPFIVIIYIHLINQHQMVLKSITVLNTVLLYHFHGGD